MSDPSLAAIGLRPGQAARFRRRDGAHWTTGSITGRELDGSLAIRDDRGRARSIPLDCVEVRSEGPRGGHVWELAAEVATRAEQLDLFAAESPSPAMPPRRRR